ncbi:MAG: acetyl-CoA carboxylase biotin carboxyl carrier protein subunit [Rhodospirillales bacterium]|jgi:biotin carboxyl carrier protein|nr:acetyl-CoA carboxylase biotin carboxyl carrier protein subunit [Rhodospirillaceae bacterium]MDP6427015.1 acetyl-CoA carboxylase biotin carboxyl carrier protein subunit [Rhodospirillales bacterium]MDP6643657.1 acetyl-CoA carboxylase biotin carboxyl carrier protein subunit [Rhodospirillales bacterium]MDP6840260.1 acetyl-CoA carboxylase biotin carboxyl carrier protein subunit [Rhodospirillales bacterium]|tara:strand:- start:1615 stop:1830 length:216 start_codon:yes stop_codon:yes gene_type:complete
MSTEVTAPMSGDILEILVKVGDDVSAEDELLILEAMKMENPIYAPADGKVTEIKVAEGDSVEANDVLVVLE